MSRSCPALLLVALAAVPTTLVAQSAPRVVVTDGAPKQIGPYSQGVISNGFLFTAGQIGRDPATGKLVEGGLVAEVNRVFDNLEAVVTAAGARLADVVKATVFMTDLADFEKMNAVYAQRLGEARPARSTVQVAKLPGGASIEIELVVQLPRSTPRNP
ncbi:MAG: Rid family detoxifying hydrolase [Gemmatimonadales bacterium]|jgi:2-iminobutanoate/2-iminopropanoate deaminase|nr:Rid family detoxifying hydrolase [Gemmatimonadales bacterium]MBP6571421.1 Rid family detoxifying hydrolase [Gemmatimonadales bacterium]MBP9899733.1 Rid family detoxifying hydrolase [Gemmatimonadales bacterium]